MRGRVADLGIEVLGVGVKDVVLPSEMKEILNGVVQAAKLAEANVIRRREETNATRSALNTAKLIDENPTLMRPQGARGAGEGHREDREADGVRWSGWAAESGGEDEDVIGPPAVGGLFIAWP